MKKGIWEDFDGYDGINEEIKASRIAARKRSFELDFADQYIKRLHPDRLALKVADIIQETPTTKTLRLVSADNDLPPFQAGQYLSLFIEIEGIRTTRPYSISSQPNQIGYYDITVKQVANGLVSNFLLDHVKEVAGASESATFFLCGPQGMYDFCLSQIEQLGVPRRKIRKELYGPPLDICQDPGWPKEIEQDRLFSVSVKDGQTIGAPATTPLLVSLEKGGVVLPSICRSGECSMCRIKILSGKVFQPADTPVRKSDHQYGYVHSCVSYPLEDLEILL